MGWWLLGVLGAWLCVACLQMGAVPTGTAGMEPEPEAAETDDLQARLDALRNG
eukprot:COSAG01_NODE_4489_length_4981_cov_1.951454_3_plen_53_part_00